MKGIKVGTMKITDEDERLCKICIILGEGDAEFDISSENVLQELRWLFARVGFASEAEGENKLRPCTVGTFLPLTVEVVNSDIYYMCIKCPAGGFYSNTEGYVSDSCRRCGNGTYVPYNKAPGKREQDCIACPQGTNTESFAGFRACKCFKTFYRTDLFKGCNPCSDTGFTCADDIATLKAGYWWQWKNKTHKNIYRNFTENHLNATTDLAKPTNFSFPDNSTKFPYTLPKPYNCPREEACTGGLDSSCEVGYEGPLCGVCSAGYYKQLQACQLCPTRQWMIGQLCIVTAVILIIIAVVVWVSKKKSKKREGRSTLDMILGRLKIVIGFYQVTSGLLEAFAYIKWPDSLALIGKYSEMLQLNVFQIAPIHCMFPVLKVDAFGSLFAILGMNAAAIFISFSVYGIRKLVLIRSTLDDEQKVLKLSNTKTLIYKNLFFFLYVSYLSLCSKTASVLSLACRSLCFYNNEEEEWCPKFLKADYSISCDSPRYKQLGIVGYVAVGYVLILPTASLVVLLSKRKVLGGNQTEDENEITDTQEQSGELLTGLRFMFENYNPHTWYWEFIETVRKVVLTSGLILLGGESRAYVGLACVLAGLYGVFFAHKGPIRDPFENRLMVISLAVTFVNLGIGAVSRIPQEKVPALIDPYLDTIMFKTLVFGANALVIGLLCVQYIVYIYRYIKEWRKNPKWSLSCCLALLLPLNELQGEIRGMADTNITKHQLQTGDITMSTISSALKDSGVMNITLKKGEPGLEEHDTDEPTNDSSETPKHTGQVIGKNDARLSSTLKDSKVANAGHQEYEASLTEGQIKQKIWTSGGTVVTIHFAKTYDTKL